MGLIRGIESYKHKQYNLITLLAKIIPLFIALFKEPVIIVLFCTGVRVRLSKCLFLKTQNRLELPHDVSISGIVEEHVVQLLDWLHLGGLCISG